MSLMTQHDLLFSENRSSYGVTYRFRSHRADDHLQTGTPTYASIASSLAEVGRHRSGGHHNSNFMFGPDGQTFPHPLPPADADGCWSYGALVLGVPPLAGVVLAGLSNDDRIAALGLEGFIARWELLDVGIWLRRDNGTLEGEPVEVPR